MKTLILAIAITMTSLVSYSQARINYTRTQIAKEFKDNSSTTGFDKKFGPYVTYDMGYYSCTYFFKNNDKCYQVLVIIYEEEDLNIFINHYNETLIKETDFVWKKYENGAVLTVTLGYVRDHYIFVLE